jgi:hypothetical protein
MQRYRSAAVLLHARPKSSNIKLQNLLFCYSSRGIGLYYVFYIIHTYVLQNNKICA